MSYTYNLDGSLATLKYPSGSTVTYTPWQNGTAIVSAPSYVKDVANNISYATQASYGADGSLTGFLSGQSATFNGITNSFSYNKRLQPVNIDAVLPSAANVFSNTYDFHSGAGDNGNVWAITNNRDTTCSQTFAYDTLNRLTSAQNSGSDCSKTVLNGKTEYWGNSYGYDAWGNLINKTTTKCGAENLQLTALTNNQLSGYDYDSAGNMISDPTDGLTLAYDAETRITGASGYTYTYDADGNRVKKSNGTTGTLYWYMSPGIVAESDLSGNLKSEYVFFNGERVARRDYPAGSVAYYFSDHLKTASVITDSAGNIKAESDYYPWGGELQFVNSDTNHYKFTGKERDETGLDYFGARYYSNGLGRFITPDWAAKATAVPYAEFADPQSLNLYTYVRNIPTVNADPDGHKGDLALLGPIIISPQDVQNALDQISSIAQGIWDASGTLTGMPTMLPPNPNCSCPDSQQQNSDDKNKNNSKSENQNEKGGQGGEKRGKPSQLKKGKEAHKNEEVRPGEKAEVRTPSGRRMDRYNDTDGHIREIKPDNARGRKAGQKQLRDYKQEMDKATGKTHTTELTTYDNN